VFSINCVGIVVVAVFNQNSPLNIAIPLHLNSCLLIVDNSNMTEQVKVLVPVLSKDIDEGLDDINLL
jgi:hypothetical protein